jgi:hypothetical protein
LRGDLRGSIRAVTAYAVVVHIEERKNILKNALKKSNQA